MYNNYTLLIESSRQVRNEKIERKTINEKEYEFKRNNFKIKTDPSTVPAPTPWIKLLQL